MSGAGQEAESRHHPQGSSFCFICHMFLLDQRSNLKAEFPKVFSCDVRNLSFNDPGVLLRGYKETRT